MFLTEYSKHILNLACWKLNSLSFFLIFFPYSLYWQYNHPQSPKPNMECIRAGIQAGALFRVCVKFKVVLCRLGLKAKPWKQSGLALQRITSMISLDFVTIGQGGIFYPRVRVLLLLFVSFWILITHCFTWRCSEIFPGGGDGQLGKWRPGLINAPRELKFWRPAV